jgi:hypothetical protein
VGPLLKLSKLWLVGKTYTTDLNKPFRYNNTALNLKVDKVAGKGLSTEDYSTVEKTKLAALTGKGNYSFTSSRKHCC